VISWAGREIRQFFGDSKAAIQAIAKNRSALIVANLLLLPWFGVIVSGHNTNPFPALGEISGLMFVYWFFTRRREIESVRVANPIGETAIALALVLVWVLFRIGQYSNVYKLPAVPILTTHELFETILPKMVEMFLVPLLIWLLLRYRPRELGFRFKWRDWVPALAPILLLVGIGLYDHIFQTWFENSVYFFFGAGLPEEFLFRSILQTRLEALLKNPIWAIYLGALIFGASHLPINLSGASANNWLSAFETAFTFQMSVGFALGFAYQRVRNIIPLTIIHTFINAAP
jgi:membrane protease YdiL (CAAX protease family)